MKKTPPHIRLSTLTMLGGGVAATEKTDVAEAKARPKLNEKPLTGEEAATYGEPTAKAPHERDTCPRKRGVRIWEGEVYLADDFDELPAELLAAFTTDDASTPTR